MNFKRIIDYALSGNLWYTHKSLNLIWTRTSHNQLAIFCKHQELQKAQSGGLARSISTSSDISVEEVEHKDNEISKLKEIVKDYWLKIEVSVFQNSSNALIPAESQNVGARWTPVWLYHKDRDRHGDQHRFQWREWYFVEMFTFTDICTDSVESRSRSVWLNLCSMFGITPTVLWSLLGCVHIHRLRHRQLYQNGDNGRKWYCTDIGEE